MSNLAPPNRHTPEQEPYEILDSSDAYVLDHPVSARRVDSLRDKIREQLNSSMPTFVLTEIAGSRHRVSTYESRLRFGSATISFKGPFVEGSNWAEMREREFALSIDRFLQKQFAELLLERSSSAPSIPREAAAIREFVRGAKVEMEAAGGRPDIVVILDSPTADRVERLLMDDSAWWSSPRVLRGNPLRDVVYVHGALEGLPTLQIFELDEQPEPTICVVDLDDYELVLTNVSENSDDYLDFTVTPIDPEEARRRIDANPALRERMYRGKHHSEGAFSYGEAVLHMQLMADYHLTAAGEVREQNLPRTVTARLED